MGDNDLNIVLKPTDKQKICWKYLRDNDTKYILFGGGAGGGKSWLGCEWLLTMCLAYPGFKGFIARNELKRIMNSTYMTWLKVCKHHKIPRDAWKLDSKHNFIEFWNGSRIDLLDMAWQPRDPLYERVGSTEYTCGWLEEIGEIREKAYDVLKSRIGRHLNKDYGITSKIFLTCNPKKNWAYKEFYQPWKQQELPSNKQFIQSLYKDNPHTADEYEQNLRDIKDNVLRERLMNGNWEYDDDDSILIDYDAITDLFSNNFLDVEHKEFYLTVDVARFGRDKAVIMLWQGYFIRKVYHYAKSGVDFQKEKIEALCDQYHIPRSNVVIDEDGVGGGLVDSLYGVKGFVGGSRAVEEIHEDVQETDRYSYRNLRSQCFFKLADKINNREMGIDTNSVDTEVQGWIVEELESIKRKDVEKNEKKLQIISKEQMKEQIARSPDFADAMMMRMYFDLGLQAVGEVTIAW